MLSKGVVSLLQHLRDLDDLGVTMGVTGGGVVTLLNIVRLCGRSATRRPWICMEIHT
jgi:hypothetical protein